MNSKEILQFRCAELEDDLKCEEERKQPLSPELAADITAIRYLIHSVSKFPLNEFPKKKRKAIVHSLIASLAPLIDNLELE
jgi:hypothetical protein